MLSIQHILHSLYTYDMRVIGSLIKICAIKGF